MGVSTVRHQSWLALASRVPSLLYFRVNLVTGWLFLAPPPLMSTYLPEC